MNDMDLILNEATVITIAPRRGAREALEIFRIVPVVGDIVMIENSWDAEK